MNLIPRNTFVLDLELFVEGFDSHFSVCNSYRRDVPVRWTDRIAAFCRRLSCGCAPYAFGGGVGPVGAVCPCMTRHACTEAPNQPSGHPTHTTKTHYVCTQRPLLWVVPRVPPSPEPQGPPAAAKSGPRRAAGQHGGAGERRPLGIAGRWCRYTGVVSRDWKTMAKRGQESTRIKPTHVFPLTHTRRTTNHRRRSGRPSPWRRP